MDAWILRRSEALGTSSSPLLFLPGQMLRRACNPKEGDRGAPQRLLLRQLLKLPSSGIISSVHSVMVIIKMPDPVLVIYFPQTPEKHVWVVQQSTRALSSRAWTPDAALLRRIRMMWSRIKWLLDLPSFQGSFTFTAYGWNVLNSHHRLSILFVANYCLEWGVPAPYGHVTLTQSLVTIPCLHFLSIWVVQDLHDLQRQAYLQAYQDPSKSSHPDDLLRQLVVHLICKHPDGFKPEVTHLRSVVKNISADQEVCERCMLLSKRKDGAKMSKQLVESHGTSFSGAMQGSAISIQPPRGGGGSRWENLSELRPARPSTQDLERPALPPLSDEELRMSVLYIPPGHEEHALESTGQGEELAPSAGEDPGGPQSDILISSPVGGYHMAQIHRTAVSDNGWRLGDDHAWWTSFHAFPPRGVDTHLVSKGVDVMHYHQPAEPPGDGSNFVKLGLEELNELPARCSVSGISPEKKQIILDLGKGAHPTFMRREETSITADVDSMIYLGPTLPLKDTGSIEISLSPHHDVTSPMPKKTHVTVQLRLPAVNPEAKGMVKAFDLCHIPMIRLGGSSHTVAPLMVCMGFPQMCSQWQDAAGRDHWRNTPSHGLQLILWNVLILPSLREVLHANLRPHLPGSILHGQFKNGPTRTKGFPIHTPVLQKLLDTMRKKASFLWKSYASS